MPHTNVSQPRESITGVSTIAERLKEARLEAGLSQPALARMVGVSSGTIGNIEAGTRENPRELLAIAAAVNVRPEWLKDGSLPKRFGVGEPAQGAPAPTPGPTSNVADGPAVRGLYPLISEVQAGRWTELCDNFQPGDADEWYPSTKNLGPYGYFLKVTGKSMENPSGRPSFTEGMLLHVRPDLEAIPGNFVVVRREATKEATFKKYILIEGAPYLEAINPDWPKEEKYLKLLPGDAWCGVVVDASLGGLA